jgi:hypothetical protein
MFPIVKNNFNGASKFLKHSSIARIETKDTKINQKISFGRLLILLIIIEYLMLLSVFKIKFLLNF